MHERLEARLAALRKELETGKETLGQIQQQEVFVRERLLVLEGAIQALSELRDDIADDGAGLASVGA